MEGLYSSKLLLSYHDDDDYRMGTPYDLHITMIINKDISKRDSSLAPSKLV